jgi:multiple sugar transport system substrate-binding protein
VRENEPVALRGITWDHPRGFASVRGAAAAYEKIQPGTSVEWQARSLQGFAGQPLEALVDEYDLLVIDHPHIPHAVGEGLLLPLDGQGFDDDLAELARYSVGPSHQTYQSAGHQYGLAIDVAALVAIHRPDLNPEPPTTWPEVMELAWEGRVIWPCKPVDAVSSFLTLSANRGAAIAEGPFIDRDAGLSILSDLHDLVALIPPACLDENPIQTAERLSTTDEWSYVPLSYGYVNYSRAGFRPNRLAYVDIPEGPRGVAGSCLGGAGIAVSARTAHPEAAVGHAFWLASADVQRGVYYAAGGQPGHAAAWEDDTLNADALDFFRGTRQTLERSWVRPRLDGWLDVQDEAGILINQALRGELSDVACLSATDQKTARLLEETERT